MEDDVSAAGQLMHVLTCPLKLTLFACGVFLRLYYECVCTARRPTKACDQVQVPAASQRQARRRSALCPHWGRMDSLFGDGVCPLGKTVGAAFISIHHLRRDDLAFREAGHLSALLMMFWCIRLLTNFLTSKQGFLFASLQQCGISVP